MGALTQEERATLERAIEIIERVLAREGGPGVVIAPQRPSIAWGQKVSQVFRDRIWWIVDDLFPYPDAASDLMSCIAWESGRTFDPAKKNLAGSGATGLIQFMPMTALGFWYSAAEIKAMSRDEQRQKGRESTAKLAAMSAEDQLNYVWRYFEPYRGRIQNLGDMYMAILWPPGVGQPDHYVLWDKATRPKTYRQNAGLDENRDDEITKAECSAKLYAMKAEGLRLAA